jgi:hypothetical protein
MKSHVCLVLAAILLGAFHSAAQEAIPQPILPFDQLPPGAKPAGPEDPEYVAWSKTHPVTMTEFLDGNHIDKWDWKTGTTINLLTAQGCAANNGSKSTPALSADLFGDWREEVMWRTTDGHALRIYSTTIPTEHRIFTLMHDPMYRLAIAWQNVAYNQPPHTGFYLGAETKFPVPRPNITVVTGK